jgi:hypothetical protein
MGVAVDFQRYGVEVVGHDWSRLRELGEEAGVVLAWICGFASQRFSPIVDRGDKIGPMLSRRSSKSSALVGFAVSGLAVAGTAIGAMAIGALGTNSVWMKTDLMEELEL